MTSCNFKLSPSQLQAEGLTYNPVPDNVRRLIIEQAGDRALSLYVEATSHAKTFTVTANMLAARLNWNPKTVTKYLAKLRDLGLACLRKVRTKKGTFLGSRWLFSQLPKQEWKPMAEQQSDFFDDRDTTLPTLHETASEKTTTKNITNINLKQAQAKPPQRSSENDRIAAFERFWQLYPRKEAKIKARRVFMKKTQNMTLDRLEQFTDTIITDVKQRIVFDAQWSRTIAMDKASIPYPATYLNHDRWEDEWQVTPMFGDSAALEKHLEMGGTRAEFFAGYR